MTLNLTEHLYTTKGITMSMDINQIRGNEYDDAESIVATLTDRIKQLELQISDVCGMQKGHLPIKESIMEPTSELVSNYYLRSVAACSANHKKRPKNNDTDPAAPERKMRMAKNADNDSEYSWEDFLEEYKSTTLETDRNDCKQRLLLPRPLLVWQPRSLQLRSNPLSLSQQLEALAYSMSRVLTYIRDIGVDRVVINKKDRKLHEVSIENFYASLHDIKCKVTSQAGEMPELSLKTFFESYKHLIRKSARTPIVRSILSQGVRDIMKILNEMQIRYILKIRYPDCEDKHTLPFDICIEIEKCTGLIKYDSAEHFGHVPEFDKSATHFVTAQIKDTDGTDYCRSIGIPLLRIAYCTSVPQMTTLLRDYVKSVSKEEGNLICSHPDMYNYLENYSQRSLVDRFIVERFITTITAKDFCKFMIILKAENVAEIEHSAVERYESFVKNGKFTGYVESTLFYLVFTIWYRETHFSSCEISCIVFFESITPHTHINKTNGKSYKPEHWDVIDIYNVNQWQIVK